MSKNLAKKSSEEHKVKKLSSSDRCMHIAKGTDERCRNRKTSGSEYCHVHSSPSKTASKKVSPSKKSRDDE